MIKVNWKNLTENLIITVIIFIVGAFVGHKVTKITSESVVEILKPTIDKAIDKDTVENSIYNAINNNFEKIKKSDSLTITIDQQPANDNRPTTTVNKAEDCVVNQSQFDALSDGEKRRLKRWLKD
ncbi:MAG: hypothetical protein CMO82_11130 [Winogradskyella sp.]|jgi:ABC-type transport system involved in multi-copper enzyme maturation permease subunit|nr:hypothetical protein [Winogradskyella sp.]|tara:strand:- start:222 stop:596 length:375 start_codon:yes stop_codon:yes gene_type:complete